ncbi:MAG: hypothetical protein KF891_11640 [Rhizobacter sp.]|nr:hypothetical protein [Rhizobacter sp.]
MFIVEAQDEMPMAAQLGGEAGQKFFSTAALSTMFPWYLITLALKDGSARFLHTVCCSWEEDLIPQLRRTEAREPVAVQQVVLDPAGAARWTTRDIRRIWVQRVGLRQYHTVLEDDSGTEFSGPFGGVDTGDPNMRTLVFEARGGAYSRDR